MLCRMRSRAPRGLQLQASNALHGRVGLPAKCMVSSLSASTSTSSSSSSPMPPHLAAAAKLPGSGSNTDSFSMHFSLDKETLELARKEGPVAAYEKLVQQGVLQSSEHQERILHMLSAIYHSMVGKGTVKGLYLHGSVGSGKSMMMDLFYACVSHHIGQGRCHRMHFHEFMHMVHRMMHQVKGGDSKHRPVELVAKRLVNEMGTLLCFDEMAITTIQDCCLLAPLFQSMWEAGIVTIMTSNRAPEELYAGGLNRHMFLPPFVSALRGSCRVVPLMLEIDYRKEQVARSGVAAERVFAEGSAAEGFAEEWWQKATGGAEKKRVPFMGGYGRTLDIVAHDGVALTSFEEMCKKSRSVEDFHSLCNTYHTVILNDIPALEPEQHNEARRFTNLIDASYEAHTRLIACFRVPLEEVLKGLTGLRDVGEDEVGAVAGCGDGDTSSSSSGVLEAVARMKAAMKRGPTNAEVMSSVFPGRPPILSDLGASTGEVKDIDIWKQSVEEGDLMAPPQVSKRWDDRRRSSQFSWESSDPTAEQQTIKGVFVAAVASLKETGFASARTLSRLTEMQSNAYLNEWAHKRGIKSPGPASSSSSE